MLSVEGIGKNIEQAIENALFELKAPREDVDIKILSEGGLFKKAKVLVSISEDCREKYEKKAEKKASSEQSEAQKVEAKEEVKEEKKAAKNEEKQQKKIEKEEEKAAKKAETCEDETAGCEKEEKREAVDAKAFLEGFLNACGKEGCTISESEDENYITYMIDGENLGDLIGHRGEAFYALNRLLTAVVGKSKKRILLDIGGYREKRVETLTQLALRTANKVAKSGRYARLDPMNPADRRIIHTALQNDGRVSTLSKGEEPRRYVMIFPTDSQE